MQGIWLSPGINDRTKTNGSQDGTFDTQTSISDMGGGIAAKWVVQMFV
jgi:hypothetical protein